MLRVGLTGNIASGKSSVARAWRRLGAAVIDADELAREAIAPGTPGLERVAREFGAGVLQDGRLDRAALRRVVFGDDDARERLEAIVHPEVGRLREEREHALEADGVRVVVHDIPLLFEAGLEDEFGLIVLVDAPTELRLARLVRERGLDEDEARRMIRAQMPAAAKRERANIVIRNTGTLEELEAEAEREWREVGARADASA